MSDSSFSPSDFMRARRPEIFSDSHTVIESRLTRELLEYHLDTLTSRKQETEFEYFAKRLAEKEICPNLIPQTGPTGGGDSKTDTETYPVSDAIAERWYQGIGREASSERWAFAFSAKKEWRPKVQGDVKKIVATNRDYKRIIFITNQFVRDKVRAEIEDELTRLYSIPVRIHDRSWIIDKVFTNDRQALTIESLHLTGFDNETNKKGPRDLNRETELRELDAEIADTARYQGVEYQLAEDCLRSAELARGLELPRVEVDESGCALLTRAYQKFDAGKYYDAIRFYGRAQNKLIKHEYRNQLVAALIGCGLAYEAVGLLWAARTCVLAGTSQLFGEFLEDGTLPTRALSSVQKLTWIELQLGRIPCVLSFMELADILAGHLQLEEKRRKSFETQRETQDKVFGILLLSAPLEDLFKLAFLPQTLERRQLPYSHMALLYALGYETFLRDEGWIPQKESTESVREFFEQWINQPAKDDLPEQPILLSGVSTTELRSCILGCDILIDTACDLGSIQLAETILGALEALLATSAGQMELMPYRQELRLNIMPLSDGTIADPSFQIKEQEGVPVIEIRHPPLFSPTTVEARTKQKDWILELILFVLPQFVIVLELQYIEQLAKEESAFSRSLNFSEVSVSTSNVLGNTPKLLLNDWEKEPRTCEFPPLRTEPWFAHLPKTADDKDSASVWSKLGEGSPPPKLLHDMRTAKHGEHNVASLIDIPLWDRAKWRATAFMSTLNDRTPPVLGIGFQDEAAGKTIFQALRKRLGNIDATEELRISIITGIDRSNPFAYAVVIGSNPKANDFKKGFLTMVSRINRMEARDPQNLTRFLESYHRAGKYLIVPAAFSNPQNPPQFFVEFAIGKTELHVLPAWLIGENDPDSCVLSADDDPIIPEGETDPPVRRALDRVRSRRGNR